MNNLIYIIGLIVVVVFILKFLGLWQFSGHIRYQESTGKQSDVPRVSLSIVPLQDVVADV